MAHTSFSPGGSQYLPLDGSKDMTGDFIPGVTNTYDLGGDAPVKWWMIGYIRQLHFDSLSGGRWDIPTGGDIRTTENATDYFDLESYDTAYRVAIKLIGGLAELYRVGGNNLPSSDPSDGSGQIWNDGGVLTVGT